MQLVLLLLYFFSDFLWSEMIFVLVFLGGDGPTQRQGSSTAELGCVQSASSGWTGHTPMSFYARPAVSANQQGLDRGRQPGPKPLRGHDVHRRESVETLAPKNSTLKSMGLGTVVINFLVQFYICFLPKNPQNRPKTFPKQIQKPSKKPPKTIKKPLPSKEP